jgi:hypothetical protein
MSIIFVIPCIAAFVIPLVERVLSDVGCIAVPVPPREALNVSVERVLSDVGCIALPVIPDLIRNLRTRYGILIIVSTSWVAELAEASLLISCIAVPVIALPVIPSAERGISDTGCIAVPVPPREALNVSVERGTEGCGACVAISDACIVSFLIVIPSWVAELAEASLLISCIAVPVPPREALNVSVERVLSDVGCIALPVIPDLIRNLRTRYGILIIVIPSWVAELAEASLLISCVAVPVIPSVAVPVIPSVERVLSDACCIALSVIPSVERGISDACIVSFSIVSTCVSFVMADLIRHPRRPREGTASIVCSCIALPVPPREALNVSVERGISDACIVSFFIVSTCVIAVIPDLDPVPKVSGANLPP